jgi:hypothetical protein
VYHALHLAELEVSRSYDAVKLQRSVVAARQAPDDQMTLAVGQWRLQPGHAQRLSSVVLPYHCLKCSVRFAISVFRSSLNVVCLKYNI